MGNPEQPVDFETKILLLENYRSQNNISVDLVGPDPYEFITDYTSFFNGEGQSEKQAYANLVLQKYAKYDLKRFKALVDPLYRCLECIRED